MLTELLKAYIVGFCVAVPAGPVLLFVLQKTLRYGRIAGIAAGAGSAFVDAAYSFVGLLALSLVMDFITANEAVISIIGGIAIVLIGINMSRNDMKEVRLAGRRELSSSGFTLQAMGLVISNPGALGVMMAILAIFGLNSAALDAPIWSVPLCVFAGELSYWTLLSLLVDRFINVTPDKLKKLSFLSGVIIAVVGGALFFVGIMKLMKLI